MSPFVLFVATHVGLGFWSLTGQSGINPFALRNFYQLAAFLNLDRFLIRVVEGKCLYLPNWKSNILLNVKEVICEYVRRVFGNGT
jgi:hypothetical protein